MHEGRSLEVCFNVTAIHENARMKVVLKGETACGRSLPGTSEAYCSERLGCTEDSSGRKEVSAFLSDEAGRDCSCTCRGVVFENREKPVHKPAQGARRVGSQEELYLLHLEQAYRHVTLPCCAGLL